MKNALIFCFLVIMCVFISSSLYSQGDPIDIDKSLGRLPFDSPFKLRKEIKKDSKVLYVGLTETDEKYNPKKSKYSQYDALINTLKLKYPKFSLTELKGYFPNKLSISKKVDYEIKKEEKKTYLEISVPPLKVGQYYSLHVVTEPDGKILTKIYNLISHNDWTTARPLFDKDLGTHFSRDKNKQDFIFEMVKRELDGPIKTFQSNAKRDLKTLAGLKCCTKLTNSYVTEVLEKIVDCPECSKKYSFEFRTDSLETIVHSLINLTKKDFCTKFISGKMPLFASSSTVELKDDDYINRLKNIQKNIALFHKLVNLIETISNVEPSTNVTNLNAEINQIKTCISSNHKLIKTLVDELEKIVSRINSDPVLVQILNIPTSTFIYNFQTRSKLVINPDFGFIYYGNDLKNQFSTYLGVNINFKPIDQNIPWSNYPNKSFWHYWSFHMGVTLVSLAEEGRTLDFYGGRSMNTGLAFRLGHVVRINGGLLWFRKQNLNPLIENSTVATRPYVGISLDLSVKSLFNGIEGLFK